MELPQLLARSVTLQASDVHLSAGLVPLARVHGQLQTLDPHPLEADALQRSLGALLGPSVQARYRPQQDVDAACELPGLGRFRVHAFWQARGPAAVLRVVPTHIPTLDELSVPAALREAVLQPHGLVLVVGATGSGKSTTLAALLLHRNQQCASHILTLEDPIEFVHTPVRSLVHQRELGTHFRSFAQALRSAMRADPDCILVGEMRDVETMRLALTAAETGHLVLASLHSASAVQALDRIVDAFPGEEKLLVRSQLAQALQAIAAQTLVARTPGERRMAAFEVLLATPAVRHLIREGKMAQIYSSMQTGAGSGMQTMAHSLQTLQSSATQPALTPKSQSPA